MRQRHKPEMSREMQYVHLSVIYFFWHFSFLVQCFLLWLKHFAQITSEFCPFFGIYSSDFSLVFFVCSPVQAARSCGLQVEACLTPDGPGPTPSHCCSSPTEVCLCEKKRCRVRGWLEVTSELFFFVFVFDFLKLQMRWGSWGVFFFGSFHAQQLGPASCWNEHYGGSEGFERPPRLSELSKSVLTPK